MGSTIFDIIGPDGKLRGQSTSRTHAKREIRWMVASGWQGPFTIGTPKEGKEIRYRTYWGWSWSGRSPRYVGPWCPAKLGEFIKRFGRGDPVRELEVYFDTSCISIASKARQLGFPRRIDDPRTFEKHRGRWTEREDELINFMYDEATPIASISGAIPRSRGAIRTRLDTTAAELSTRSAQGRFIAKPGCGRRGVFPVAEPGVDSVRGANGVKKNQFVE